MQHKNSIDKFRNIDDPECTGHVSNPDSSNPLPNRWHRFLVVRFETVLHLIELIPRFSPCHNRKGAKIVKGIISKLDWPRITHIL